MTYSESATGCLITITRALQELEEQGITDWESTEDFFLNCWTPNAVDNKLDAVHLFDWLGY